MTIEFHTTVSKNGVIKIPSRFKLEDSKVKITIEPEQVVAVSRNSAADFISKWKGFLNGTEVSDEDRFNYLSEKYK